MFPKCLYKYHFTVFIKMGTINSDKGPNFLKKNEIISGVGKFYISLSWSFIYGNNIC